MIVKMLQRMRSLPPKKSEFFIIQPPGRELYGDKRLVKSSQSSVSTYVSLRSLKVTGGAAILFGEVELNNMLSLYCDNTLSITTEKHRVFCMFLHFTKKRYSTSETPQHVTAVGGDFNVTHDRIYMYFIRQSI